MKLSKSQAHYIKTVYELSVGCEGVRIMDIAEKLSLSKASVSLAMTKFAQYGFVRKDAERHIYLTENGEREAVRMLDRSDIIRRFLTGILGVNEEAAQYDACAMEHVISVDTLCAMCRFIRKTDARRQCTEDCHIQLQNSSGR